MEAASNGSQGTMARRQALNACDACRQRKTKCDESKPSCGRCARLGLECSYIETISTKKNLSVAELNGTLKRMDEKLESLTDILVKSQADYQNLLRRTGGASVSGPSPSFSHIAAAVTPGAASVDFAATTASSPPFLDTGRIRDELSLSQRHSTAPQHLLSWPCSPIKLSEAELQYPMELEIKVPRLSRSTAPPKCIQSPGGQSSWVSQLSTQQVNLLTRYYFEHFHPSCLILDESQFYTTHFTNAMRSDFSDGISTCIVLFVCALGSVAAHAVGHPDWTQETSQGVGVGFFNLACELFRDIEGADWESTQCLLLMGRFHSSKLRVYNAWRAIHSACATMLILVPLQSELNHHNCQLFWIAYLQESQILAEYDFPASGLGKLASIIPLPVAPDAGSDPRMAQYQFFFLGLITLRKLLNRVLYHLYSRDHQDDSRSAGSPAADNPTMFLSASRSIVNELNYQLEEWRTHLPSGLQFSSYSPSDALPNLEPYQIRSTDDRLRGHLMTRYFAAKSIIHRPFIYRTLHCDRVDHLSDEDKLGAHVAVSTANLSFYYSGMLHEPLALLLHPINSWRSMFALELEVIFVLRAKTCDFALPQDWEFSRHVRRRIASVAAHMCPTVARDNDILEQLTP